MSRRIGRGSFVAAVAGAALGVLAGTRGAEADDVPDDGTCSALPRLAPGSAFDARVAGLDGPDVRLADLRGYAVWLVFFTTWCAGCTEETPAVLEAARRLHGDGLRVVGVSVDEHDDVVRRYRDRFGVDFPLAIDRRGKLFTSLSLEYLPSSLFIDREGALRCARSGELSSDAISRELAAIV